MDEFSSITLKRCKFRLFPYQTQHKIYASVSVFNGMNNKIKQYQQWTAACLAVYFVPTQSVLKVFQNLLVAFEPSDVHKVN